MTEVKKALFSGDWLYDEKAGKYTKAYEGFVRPDGWWSGGVQWSATHDVVQVLVADQGALAEESPEVGRLTVVVDRGANPVALVTYEPADGEFYIQHFDDDDRVQVPSWTWTTVDEADVVEVVRTPGTDIDAVIAALQGVGLDARPDDGPSPTVITVQAGEQEVLLSYDFNREDGGWEAAVNGNGEQFGLEDGPLAEAAPADVAAWVRRLVDEGLVPF